MKKKNSKMMGFQDGVEFLAMMYLIAAVVCGAAYLLKGLLILLVEGILLLFAVITFILDMIIDIVCLFSNDNPTQLTDWLLSIMPEEHSMMGFYTVVGIVAIIVFFATTSVISDWIKLAKERLLEKSSKKTEKSQKTDNNLLTETLMSDNSQGKIKDVKADEDNKNTTESQTDMIKAESLENNETAKKKKNFNIGFPVILMCLCLFIIAIVMAFSLPKACSDISNSGNTQTKSTTAEKPAQTFYEEPATVVEEVSKAEPEIEPIETHPLPQSKLPIQIIEEVATKNNVVGVWCIGSYMYSAIYRKNGAYYYGGIDIASESLIESDEILKRVNSHTYTGYAAYDMPERLVINSAGNLESYVFNPDMSEWVFMGENVRMW